MLTTSGVVSAITVVTLRLRFAQMVPVNALSPKILGSLVTMGVIAAPSKRRWQTKSAMPGASRLMATPETVWSAAKVTEATACRSATSAPMRPATRKATHGLPVK